MSDSNITKQAIANALKELMYEVDFSKIKINDICKKCNLNRQSFYYHFKDKYDLVNWIYDTEFASISKEKTYKTGWDFLGDLCNYFYDNSDFYTRAFSIKGQNSFVDHFHEEMLPVIAENLRMVFTNSEANKFYTVFFADAYICAIERWILEKPCMRPDKFVDLLKTCVEATTQKFLYDKEHQQI